MSKIAEMTMDDAQQVLIKVFPCLMEGFTSLQKEWEGETVPDDIVFGNLFTNYLIDLAGHVDENRESLQQGFTFIEEMLDSRSFGIRSIAEASILESILDRQPVFLKIRPFLGPNSIRVTDAIWKRWKGLP